MFSSKTNKTTETTVPAPAGAPTPQPAKRAKSGGPSLISADLTVTGTLSSAGDIQIDGTIEGDVHCASLVIGENASIIGEVVAEDVIVRGRIEGSLRARKVQLCATCHVEGNILHEAFAVETGAFFEGNCRHSNDPLADDAGRNDFKRKVAPVASAAPPASAAASAAVAAKIEEKVASAMSPATSKPAPANYTPLKS